MRRDLIVPGFCAVVVEAIKYLWSRGRFTQNKFVRMTHDNWLHHWVAIKTAATMHDVDLQVDDLHDLWDEWEAEDDFPVFSEVVKGDTPLGGPMQLSHKDIGTMEELNDNE